MDLERHHVVQAARGLGVGQALVAAAAGYASAMGRGDLTVSASNANTAAHRFYLRHGFADTPVAGRRFSTPADGATTAR